ncbi:hypothetical protein [Pseudomonas sp. TWI929]|uniref:hypothetical protein n=1 Tax=Pseudomonas sp. TWI929 TaxID=3136795 RepID=UPI00320A97BC
MFKNNKINIGSVIDCGTVVKASGEIEGNEFTFRTVQNCNEVFAIDEGRSIQQQLGLPPETDIESIREAIAVLKGQKDKSIPEKQESMKELSIWSYLERSDNIANIIIKLTDLCNSPLASRLLLP